MNLKDILFQELISLEKEQKKLPKRRLELRRLLNLKDKPFRKKFTNKRYS